MMNNEYYKHLLDIEKESKRHSVHSFHRYFGKFIPAIPAFAIKEFTKEGDNILDVFCGSGTTLVEAKLANRNGIGIDINPLATEVSKVKTTHLDSKILTDRLAILLKKIVTDKNDYINEPYCININHWFKPEVKRDLLKIRHHILTLSDKEIRNFFLFVFSAFMRNVSNADPRHVFPGYSKRLRLLDAEGKRHIDVIRSFEIASKKRIKAIDSIPINNVSTSVYNTSSRSLPNNINNIPLVIINPPYISSIRYLETIKIEMGWLGFINSQQDYLDLDKLVIGTERFYKKDLMKINSKLLIGDLDKRIKIIEQDNPKMAKVVFEYFVNIQDTLLEIVRVLKDNGHLVIIISDSTVRKELIPTHNYFIEILESAGLKTVACFKDEFDPNSRSLLTVRNSYSGIMTYDWILIFEK